MLNAFCPVKYVFRILIFFLYLSQVEDEEKDEQQDAAEDGEAAEENNPGIINLHSEEPCGHTTITLNRGK